MNILGNYSQSGSLRAEQNSLSSKRVGLYLGVQPTAGGMFQYAQCVLRSLEHLRCNGELDVLVAYGDQRWVDILEPMGMPSVKLTHLEQGNFISKLIMTVFVPPWLARILSGWFNPVAKALNSAGCDVWMFPAQDELTWQVKGPVVATIHDLMHRYERSFPEAGSWFRYLLREHRFKCLSRNSQIVIVDSKLGKRHVVESYSANQEQVKALPYVAPSYITEGRERDDFDEVYQLPTKFYFYPAQFWPHKNHLCLIKALLRAKAECSDMVVVLAGGMRLGYEKIRKKVAEAGLEDSVLFVGYVPDDDMSGFYKRAHGLVMPTFFGPTNIPPLEAMALGCPVLISNVYAMPEQCGDAALYFSPSSDEEMSAQMIRLWKDEVLIEQLSEAGRNRTRQWGQTQFEKCLGEILLAAISAINKNNKLRHSHRA